MSQNQNVRLTLRTEGHLLNAYVADVPTMHGAYLLGSMDRMSANDPERRAQFVVLMQMILADRLRQISGGDVTWRPHAANANATGDGKTCEYPSFQIGQRTNGPSGNHS